ncbi:MAG: Rieske 2Fe-2S domain-containing protein [Gammaproteobacteria bacterium]|nr:Rieske 2Fe-2S domain-containing protein [Gammaproteobacteria bacterium]MDH5727447.1 Rieske 2Fe-2S domain-containing protein [Gammaproteobacteria bacterium]
MLKVAMENELALHQMKELKLNGESIVLFRLKDGFYATQNKCPHLFAPLHKGKIMDGERIQCKFHRAEFDIRSGKSCKWANFPPGIQMLNMVRGEKDLRTFPVKVENGEVLIDIN